MARILYVTADDSNRTDSENNGFYIGKGLEATGNQIVRHFSPGFTVRETVMLGPVKLGYRALGKDFRPSVEPMVVRRKAKQLTQRIREVKPDLVLANSPFAVAGIDGRLPYVVYTDSPVSQLISMGHYCEAWPQRSVKLLRSLDQRVLEGARRVIYHSQWAAQMAIQDYGLGEDKVEVVLPGANLPSVPRSCAVLDRERGDLCELLFWGRDWKRKGGPLAVSVVEHLRRRGIRARLTICGPEDLPEGIKESESLRFFGRLSKSTTDQLSTIQKLFSEMDYLLLPTRADASTSAIRESAAFGVPSITTAIGGLPELVMHGESGLLLPQGAMPDQYAEAIFNNFTNEDARLAYRLAARHSYEDRMNWPTAIGNILEAIRCRDSIGGNRQSNEHTEDNHHDQDNDRTFIRGEPHAY